MLFFFFFFSSRRRHTRLQGDWSSDVCSSDLVGGHEVLLCQGNPCGQNFTAGAASTSLRLEPRSKKSLRVKPNMPANSAAGICWMPVLYSWTALLKKRRLAAILFSRSDNSLASCWKLALAFRSG